MTTLSETSPLLIFTIGHSNHPIEKFVEMLQAHGIVYVIDVRTIPRSRHNPQYNSDALEKTLLKSGIAYGHLRELGGLRHAKKDSVNTAWENASFRGFADYMQTQEFGSGLERLIEIAKSQRTAIMCAEAVPWRCHRSLIGDALLTRGVTVMDVMSKHTAKAHTMTPWAEVKGVTIAYPKK